ncbi:MAG: hypothetical protein KA988_02930 [Longilinea sp.]|nr:hypothetical protein [Longilinea sp.]
MRTRRLLAFLLMIGLGVVAGLLLGWGPLARTGKSGLPLSSLRSDFRSDYVLMIAEVYAQDGNRTQALEQLQALDEQMTPLSLVQQAIIQAQSLGYSSHDIRTLADLAQALQLPSLPTLAPTETP